MSKSGQGEGHPGPSSGGTGVWVCMDELAGWVGDGEMGAQAGLVLGRPSAGVCGGHGAGLSVLCFARLFKVSDSNSTT